MKRIVILLILVFVFMLGVSLTFAQSAPADSTHKYVGASKCKLCHSADKIGAQFKILGSVETCACIRRLGLGHCKGDRQVSRHR